MKCRHCDTELNTIMLDLGVAPPSNAYLNQEQLHCPELWYPLRILVCEECWLVQTEDFAQADELFDDNYAYFSSTSSSWLDHARAYTGAMTEKLRLGSNSFVIEVASNDGYLLKNFVAAGIPCLGIEPTDSTANAAEELNIPVVREFFGTSLAQRLSSEGKLADLIIGNNVYAHVPDINDFTNALKILLKVDGSITLEFPHLMRLLQHIQFDTVYHEHFSYLSMYTVQRIFEHAGLRVYDVDELASHGGSLRIYACHAKDGRRTSNAVAALIREEEEKGLRNLDIYRNFQTQANHVKDELLNFLIEQKHAGNSVAAYGAAAKGNTLLNYAGIKPDLISYVCDAAPSKQGKYLPGSRIPILPPAALMERKPDIVLILPWNIAAEVVAQQSAVHAWGGQFVVAIPKLKQVA